MEAGCPQTCGAAEAAVMTGQRAGYVHLLAPAVLTGRCMVVVALRTRIRCLSIRIRTARSHKGQGGAAGAMGDAMAAELELGLHRKISTFREGATYEVRYLLSARGPTPGCWLQQRARQG